AHPLLRQHGNVAIAPAVKDAAHVVAREHGAHPRRLFRARDVDAFDARMGMGTAQRLAPKRAGQEHIRSVARLAGNFARVIRARRRMADELITHVGLLLNWRDGVMEYCSIRTPSTPALHYSITPLLQSP